MKIEVEFPLDADGFLSRECPYCRRRFKLEEDNSEHEQETFEELYCPYCAQTADTREFFTPGQNEYMVEKVESEVVEPELDKFTEELEKIGRKSDFIDVDVNTSRKANPIPPEETDEMERIRFSCCDVSVKFQKDWDNALYCVLCGEELT